MVIKKLYKNAKKKNPCTLPELKVSAFGWYKDSFFWKTILSLRILLLYKTELPLSTSEYSVIRH